MKSKVYFISVDDSENIEDINLRLKKLLKESNILKFISEENK